MDDKAPSLEQLHDIVVPGPVSWWPLAPGWYVLLLLAIVLLAVVLAHLWYRWKANAYRRIAIAELDQAVSVRDISELLRRTALGIASRRDLAVLTGEAWPKWLAIHCPVAMPSAVHSVLAESIYRPQDPQADLLTLKTYAADWIRRHQANRPDNQGNESEVT